MRAVANALEHARWDGRVAELLESLWSRAARAHRAVRLPNGAQVIGIAGPILGGSYVTPTTEALARSLASRMVRVAVVGHGYRSRATSPRLVRETDGTATVGDEGRQLATALAPDGVPVIVGRPREHAISLAATMAPVVLVDALLQAYPQRLARSLLVVDAAEPFGAGRCPPRGDLRAPLAATLPCADALVVVHSSGVAPPDPVPPSLATFDGPIHHARSVVYGALDAEGRRHTLAELRSLRLGVVLGVARPERIQRSLWMQGIRPTAERFYGDHASRFRFRYGARFRARSIDVWLTTAKCATKLGTEYAGAPVFVLDHRVELPGSLISEIARSTACERVARGNVAPCF